MSLGINSINILQKRDGISHVFWLEFSRLKCARAAFFGLLLLLFTVAKSVVADSVYIDVAVTKGLAKHTNVGLVHAVDSWFTTLATLGFQLKDLPPGLLDVKLHSEAECDNPGPVYNPYEVESGYRIGDLMQVTVSADGSLVGKHGVKPPLLTADIHKITVTEMRGHTLVFVSHKDDDFEACGEVREGEFEPTR